MRYRVRKCYEAETHMTNRAILCVYESMVLRLRRNRKSYVKPKCPNKVPTGNILCLICSKHIS